MKKQYKKHGEEKPEVVNDPVVDYGTRSSVTAFQQPDVNIEDNYLPNELIIQAIEYAEVARKQGKLIPNAEVFDILAKRMGWATGSTTFAKTSL